MLALCCLAVIVAFVFGVTGVTLFSSTRSVWFSSIGEGMYSADTCSAAAVLIVMCAAMYVFFAVMTLDSWRDMFDDFVVCH